MKKLFLILILLCIALSLFSLNEFKKYNAIYWFEYLATPSMLYDSLFISYHQTHLIEYILEENEALIKDITTSLWYNKNLKLRYSERGVGYGFTFYLPAPFRIANHKIFISEIKFLVKHFTVAGGDTIIFHGVYKKQPNAYINQSIISNAKDTAITYSDDQGVPIPAILTYKWTAGEYQDFTELELREGETFYIFLENRIAQDSVYIENIFIKYKYMREF